MIYRLLYILYHIVDGNDGVDDMMNKLVAHYWLGLRDLWGPYMACGKDDPVSEILSALLGWVSEFYAWARQNPKDMNLDTGLRQNQQLLTQATIHHDPEMWPFIPSN